MNVSSCSSGINLIHTAQHRSENAARQIAELSTPNSDRGEIDFNSGDLIKPALDLKRAELETAAAAKIIEADQNMIGAILDIRA